MKGPLLLLSAVQANPEGHLDDVQRGRILATLRRYPNVPLDVEIREHKSKRSLDQNAFWWAVPVAILAEHCGYEPEQMHYVLLGEWRGYEDGAFGKVPRCCSSSKLTTADFTELIEWVQRWAATELDCQIPAPNEWQPAEVAS